MARGSLALRFVIKTAIPTWAHAHRWGDLFYALGLRRALDRLGHRADIEVIADWPQGRDLQSDAVIHLWGTEHDRRRPGPRHIAWIISHPERLSPEALRGFDTVFVASEELVDRAQCLCDAPVFPLLQATDVEHFAPCEGQSDNKYSPPRSDLLFVGNSRNVFRKILKDLLPTDHDLHVYGALWEPFLSDNVIRGHWVSPECLPALYRSTRLVLNDHWDAMREHGMLNNRLFDALAAGAVVISDHLDAIPKVFGETILTYRDERDLRELVDDWLSNHERRQALAEKGSRLVADAHDFGHRVPAIINAASGHPPSIPK